MIILFISHEYFEHVSIELDGSIDQYRQQLILGQQPALSIYFQQNKIGIFYLLQADRSGNRPQTRTAPSRFCKGIYYYSCK